MLKKRGQNEVKIAVFHGYFEYIAGSEATTLAILEALKEAHYEVVFYTSTRNPPDIDGVKVISTKPHHTKFISKLSKPLSRQLRFYATYRLMKKLEQSNVNAIITHDDNFLWFKTNTPIITYLHFPLTKSIIRRKIFINKIMYMIQRKQNMVHRKNIHFITNSKYTDQETKRHHVVATKIIHPPVNMDFESHDDKSGIISIGRFVKNQEFAAQVMVEIDAPCRIVGILNDATPGHAESFNECENIVKNHAHVRLHPNATDEFLRKTLIKSKVYFNPARDTFGIAVVEGIAAGCVPIVPDNSANKETVPISELRYVTGDKNSACDKLAKALNGEYDTHLPFLQNYVKQFSKEKFKKSIREYVENVHSSHSVRGKSARGG